MAHTVVLLVVLSFNIVEIGMSILSKKKYYIFSYKFLAPWGGEAEIQTSDLCFMRRGSQSIVLSVWDY